MKKILLLLGGMYHDFSGFTETTKDLLTLPQWELEPSYELDRLTNLDQEKIDLVISYTSLSKHRPGQNDTGPEKLTDNQVASLESWVQRGGGLLSIHCGTVVGESSPSLARLLGGQFIEHPPQFAYTVYPLSTAHPITDGVEAFTVHDEFYIERAEPEVQIFLTGIDRGVAYPMGWSKKEGQGRVAHVAPGHSPETWNHPIYRRLIIQAANWVCKIE
jgi:type 1 glutamine amidotransferase